MIWYAFYDLQPENGVGPILVNYGGFCPGAHTVTKAGPTSNPVINFSKISYAVVAREIKSFQNYFSLRRCPN